MQNDKSALIAMSGGVDSSVAAYLMTKQGYKCIGATMRLHGDSNVDLSEDNICCSTKDIEDAANIASRLNIPYNVLDYTVDFKTKIIEKFIRTYEAGGTPNPCVDCNRDMKFGKLLDYADKAGVHYIVTGHYVRVGYDESRGRYLLRKASDLSKDQSYVLYTLTQEQLSRTIFPLGELTKNEAREIAEQQGFCNSKKHDSQDICFIPDGDYVSFMEDYTGKKYGAGDFIDLSGNKRGEHKGAVRYTIGQRRGLGISAEKSLYVVKKDMAENIVYVGDEADLFRTTLYATDMNWISIPTPKEPVRCKAKTRYRQKEQWATAYPNDDGIRLVFDEPQRAITVGQAVVMYDDDIVVGGGTITAVEK